ncbi:TMAO reductase system periplasmic protein TorT [Serratia liquefaciens]|uniref:TMAO reductase system periplasmic protein TorT n=1 Tax=Serratia liquefaciens TaxID=614 RepID=UPI003B42FCB9
MRNAIFRFLVSFFCGTITCSALAVSPAPLVRWLNERQSEPAAATPVLQAERRWKLCALYPSLKDAYWLSINYGMVQEAQRTNVTLKIFEAGGYSQLEAQREQLTLCRQWQADAILLGSSLAQFPDLAASVGDTPVIAVVNELNFAATRSRVGVPWFQMGYQPGRYLIDHPPHPSLNVLLMPGPKDAGGSQEMIDGFRTAVEGSSIQIVDVVYGDNDVEIQRNLLQDMLEKHPEINLVAGNAIAAQVAMGEARNRPHPLGIVSFYLSHQVYRGLKRNRIIMAVSDQMVLQGELAIDQAIRVLQQQSVENNISPQILLLTPANITPEKVKLSLSPLGFRPVYLFPSVDLGRQEVTLPVPSDKQFVTQFVSQSAN